MLLAGNSTRSPASTGAPKSRFPGYSVASPELGQVLASSSARARMFAGPGLASLIKEVWGRREVGRLLNTHSTDITASSVATSPAHRTLSGMHVIAVIVSHDAHQDLRPGGPIPRCRGHRVALHGAGRRRRSASRAGDARLGGARRALVEATAPCPRPHTCAMVVAVDGQEVVERAVSRGHVRGYGRVW